MSEKTQASPDVIDLSDATEVTKGDPTPAHLEDKPRIMGRPDA